MNQDMTEDEFLEKQGKGFHLRLYKYFIAYSQPEEINEIIKGNMVIQSEFPEGVYRIRYDELERQMKQDLEDMGIDPNKIEETNE